MKSKNEQLLISHLRQDGRARLTTISKKTRIPVSTLFDMLKKTEKITKQTCLADFSKFGYTVRATIILKTIAEHRDELRSNLLKNPNTNSLWKINNGFDFMSEMIFRNISELEYFIEDLEKKYQIVEKNIYYIIDDIAREIFMSNPDNMKLFDL